MPDAVLPPSRLLVVRTGAVRLRRVATMAAGVLFVGA
jgi:hypothetical protein